MADSIKVHGQIVRKLRRDQGWTQDAVCEKALISDRTIRRVERGNVASYSTIEKLAKALGVSPTELIASQDPAIAASRTNQRSYATTPPNEAGCPGTTNEALCETSSEWAPDSHHPQSRTFAVPDLPSIYVPRPELTSDLQILIHSECPADLMDPPNQILFGIHGDPGTGKTRFLIELANTEDLFPKEPMAGIWIHLGQTPDVKGKLDVVARGLRLNLPTKTQNVDAAAAELREMASGNSMCLFVDDVWDVEHLMPFRYIQPLYLLFTTRNRALIDSVGAKSFKLPGLTPEQAETLLAETTDTKIEFADQPVVASVCSRCSFNPLMLKLIAGVIRYQQTTWRQISDALESDPSTTIVHQLDDYSHPTFAAALKLSLDSLPTNIARFASDLGALPPETPIPLDVLTVLWRPRCTNDIQVNQIVYALDARGLLQRDKSFLTIHLLVHDAIQSLTNSKESHREIAKGLETAMRSKNASPELIQYCYQYLPHHIYCSGDFNSLRNLLTNPSFLIPVIEALGAPSLVSELSRLAPDPVIQALAKQLQLSTYALETEPNRDQVIAQLLARCTGANLIQLGKNISDTISSHPTPFSIIPTPEGLRQDGSALTQTLLLPIPQSAAFQLSPNARFLVARTAHDTLEVRDLTSMERTAIIRAPDSSGVFSIDDFRFLNQRLVVFLTTERFTNESSRAWFYDVQSSNWIRPDKNHDLDKQTVGIITRTQDLIAVGPNSRYVIWNPNKPNCIKPLDLRPTDFPSRYIRGCKVEGTHVLDISEDGRYMIREFRDGRVRVSRRSQQLLDTVSSEPIFEFRDTQKLKWKQPMTTKFIGNTGEFLHVPANKPEIQLWNIEQRKRLRTFRIPSADLIDITPIGDSDSFITSHRTGELRLWNTNSPVAAATFSEIAQPVIALQYCDETGQIATATKDGFLDIWSKNEAFKRTEHVKTETGGSVHFSPDGRRYVARRYGKRVYSDLSLKSHTRSEFGKSSPIHDVAFTKTGETLFTVERENDNRAKPPYGIPKKWNLSADCKFKRDDRMPNATGVRSIAATLDGDSVFVGFEFGGLMAWRTKDLEQLYRFLQAGHRVSSLTYASHLNLLLVASQYHDNYHDLNYFDRTTNRLLDRKLHFLTARYRWSTCAFRALEPNTGQTLHKIQLHATSNIAVSPDGKIAAIASWDAITVLKLSDFSSRQLFSNRSSTIRAITFSHDGELIFTAHTDRALEAYSVSSGKKLGAFVTDWGISSISQTSKDNNLLVGDERGQVYTAKLIH